MIRGSILQFHDCPALPRLDRGFDHAIVIRIGLDDGYFLYGTSNRSDASDLRYSLFDHAGVPPELLGEHARELGLLPYVGDR